jgi:hypothetical protein
VYDHILNRFLNVGAFFLQITPGTPLFGLDSTTFMSVSIGSADPDWGSGSGSRQAKIGPLKGKMKKFHD